MKKLTPDGFNRARDFLFSQGRPLDQAIFKLEFEGGSVDNVVTQLEKYQNSEYCFSHMVTLASKTDFFTKPFI